MTAAFVLGAGLGTRLRPLTDDLPKPLVPLFNRPLITWAFDHLMNAGIERFIVNTHHLPECYPEAFPDAAYRGAPIAFVHEPDILDTAGGIANAADLFGDELIVYNGDIVADFSLQPAIDAHRAAGNLVTLILRSRGPALHIAFDPNTAAVIDIASLLESGAPHRHQFTGIYIVSRELLRWIPPRQKISVVPVFIDAIRAGARIGAAVIDDGFWLDLGNRDAYLDAHRELIARRPDLNAQRIHPEAIIAPDAEVAGFSCIAQGASVGPAAVTRDSILWPGSAVAPGSQLRRTVVRRDRTAAGILDSTDV